jgi:hypothetical protein
LDADFASPEISPDKRQRILEANASPQFKLRLALENSLKMMIKRPWVVAKNGHA